MPVPHECCGRWFYVPAHDDEAGDTNRKGGLCDACCSPGWCVCVSVVGQRRWRLARVAHAAVSFSTQAARAAQLPGPLSV